MEERHGRRSGLYLRNFVFGVEDSLVSTVGLLSGIAIAEVPQETIILTGTVLIFVEAFSMGVGSFLAEHSADDYVMQAETPAGRSLGAGLVMFVSYFAAGFIPLAPYVLFAASAALVVSVAASLIALFLLGIVGASLAHVRIVTSGLRMLVVGGIAILIGVLVGGFLNIR